MFWVCLDFGEAKARETLVNFFFSASGTRVAVPELLAGSGPVEQNIEHQRTKIMAGAVDYFIIF